MQASEAQAMFKPQPSKAESKNETTTRAAKAIINGEEAQREAKTARLRAARVAREEAEAAAQVEPAPRKKPVRRAAAKA
jgi:hypothetical protein